MIGYELVPSDTTDKAPVTFTSSDPTVATIDENGKVTALKAGTTVITLKGANDVTAEVTVTVTEIPIDSVSLDKESAVVEKGQTTELTAVVGPETTTDENKSIKWSSSDPSVATVSTEQTNSGETVTVTATDKGGKQACCVRQFLFRLPAVLFPAQSLLLPLFRAALYLQSALPLLFCRLLLPVFQANCLLFPHRRFFISTIYCDGLFILKMR